MADIQTGMVDPWGQIVRECKAGNLPWKSVALTLAFAIRQTSPARLAQMDPPDLEIAGAISAIGERYGSNVREKIKKLAWDYVGGRKVPGGGRV